MNRLMRWWGMAVNQLKDKSCTRYDSVLQLSGLHHRFKAVTAMSPLQFQKQLRLQEARRLMLSEDLDAASAAYRVGYRDPAYFNREYKSLFGVPPIRYVQQLREEVRIGSEE